MCLCWKGGWDQYYHSSEVIEIPDELWWSFPLLTLPGPVLWMSVCYKSKSFRCSFAEEIYSFFFTTMKPSFCSPRVPSLGPGVRKIGVDGGETSWPLLKCSCDIPCESQS